MADLAAYISLRLRFSGGFRSDLYNGDYTQPKDVYQ
jgi:hypothetical protein